MLLRDRREVYRVLKENNVPVPKHVTVVADRAPRAGEYTWDQVTTDDDSLILKATGEVLLKKPFVEKPCDAEDHNVYVYFAVADGGGCQQIFRKSKNRSSEFFPNQVRAPLTTPYYPYPSPLPSCAANTWRKFSFA